MILNRIVNGKGRLGAVRAEAAATVVEVVRDILTAVRDADDRRACVASYARKFDACDVVEFDVFVEAEAIEKAKVEPASTTPFGSRFAAFEPFTKPSLPP